MLLSVDDACDSDVRVADLCEKYNVEGIFYWPVEWHSLAYSKGYKPLDINHAQYIAKMFEIGSHTITHRYLTDLKEYEAEYEIAESKYILESIFGKTIERFAPPRGYTNKHLTDVALLIYQSQRLTKGKDLVHIHPNSGANDNKPWRECITKDTKEIWGHSWEFDKYDLWGELEDFLSQL